MCPASLSSYTMTLTSVYSVIEGEDRTQKIKHALAEPEVLMTATPPNSSWECLAEEEAQFYAAKVGAALVYLHLMRFIYQDFQRRVSLPE